MSQSLTVWGLRPPSPCSGHPPSPTHSQPVTTSPLEGLPPSLVVCVLFALIICPVGSGLHSSRQLETTFSSPKSCAGPRLPCLVCHLGSCHVLDYMGWKVDDPRGWRCSLHVRAWRPGPTPTHRTGASPYALLGKVCAFGWEMGLSKWLQPGL